MTLAGASNARWKCAGTVAGGYNNWFSSCKAQVFPIIWHYPNPCPIVISTFGFSRFLPLCLPSISRSLILSLFLSCLPSFLLSYFHLFTLLISFLLSLSPSFHPLFLLSPFLSASFYLCLLRSSNGIHRIPEEKHNFVLI